MSTTKSQWVGASSGTVPTFKPFNSSTAKNTSPSSKGNTRGHGCCCGGCAQKNLPFSSKKK